MATEGTAQSVPMSFRDRVNDFVSRLGIAGELLRFCGRANCGGSFR